MAGIRAGNLRKGARAKAKPKGKAKLGGAGNCGTGNGGFKPGNVCGKGGRAKLAADLRAARAAARDGHEAKAVRDAGRGLKAHRRGKDGAIDDATAGYIRGKLRAGNAKAAKPAAKAAPKTPTKTQADDYARVRDASRAGMLPDRPARERPEYSRKKPDRPLADLPGTDFNQAAYREHSRYIQDIHAPAIAARAKALGISPEVYRARINLGLKQALDHGELYIRANSERIEDILDSGRLKSQFETGTTNGSLDFVARSQTEAEQFGTRIDIEKSQRPIYGYVSQPGFGAVASVRERAARIYGDAVIRLKPSVKARATATIGDSLAFGDRFQAARIGRPDVSMAPVLSKRWDAAQDSLLNAKMSGRDKLDALQANSTYVEAQFHGQVTLDDIQDIAFDRQPDSRTVTKLRERGVRWRVLNN